MQGLGETLRNLCPKSKMPREGYFMFIERILIYDPAFEEKCYWLNNNKNLARRWATSYILEITNGE